MTARKGNILHNLGMVFASLLAFLLLGEGAMRVFFTHEADGHARFPQGLFCQQHREYGWLGRPGASGVLSFDASDMSPMKVRINADGFLDLPRNTDERAHTRRLLFLGDSFTIGYGTPRSTRFTDLIAQRLPEGHDVINMGMWGYSTDQELLVFKDTGLAYQPDVVVLVMFLDDLFCNNLYSVNEGLYIKPRFQLTGGDNLTLGSSPMVDNRTGSHLFNMAVSRYYRLRNRLAVGADFQRMGWFAVFDRSYLDQDGFYLSLHLLGEVYSLARTQGAQFLLVIIPWKDQLRAKQIHAAGHGYAGIPRDRLDMKLPQRIVTRFCKEMGIPVLDLLEVHEDAGQEEKLFFQHDLHWTERGHRLAADQILTRLKELHYL